MNSTELRRRKVKEHQNGHTGQKRKRKHVQPSTIHQSLLCVIISGVILTLLIVLYTDNIPWHMGHKAIDHVAKVMGYYDPVYAVVLDAGSTGSRVLAFTFHKAVLDGHLVLDKELFEYTKPGLSSFADNPQGAVMSINQLMEKAKAEIPKEYWPKTPLILKATAGLRMLAPEKAEGLLNAVRKYFKTQPFLTNEDSVSIMDGTDEGIFSWFTVNFLLNTLDNSVKTVAALDLGGGSTQVTFSATTPNTLRQVEFIHNAILPKGQMPVYTNSYLGLGLMAARKEIVTHNQPNATTVFSDCINPIIKEKKFLYGGVKYNVNGLQENFPTKTVPATSMHLTDKIPIVDVDKCTELVRDYVTSKMEPPEELTNKRIFAFSYYFDRMAENGLINEFTGGSVTIHEMKKTKTKVCETANADQPFMCLDLTIITVLLENGLGIHEDTTIYLFKKIHGHEISWALGAAHDLLKNHL